MLVDPFDELIFKGSLIVFKSSAFKCEVLPPGPRSKVRLCEWRKWGSPGHLMGTVGGRLQLHVSAAGERGEFRGHPLPVWMCPLPSSGYPLSLAHIVLYTLDSEPLAAPVLPVRLRA